MPPNSTLLNVHENIHEVIQGLNFRNIQVYSPTGEGKWERRFVSSAWGANGESKYDPHKGGAEPQTTLKSVIDGDKRAYVVDIADLSTFTRQGLVADSASIENDLKCSTGPTGMIFIKIVSPISREVIAVIQIHNRVTPGEASVPGALLPKNLTEAERVLTQLEAIFDEAALAIESIRQREASAPPPRRLFSFDAAKMLSEDGLYNPNGDIPYPRNEREFSRVLSRLVDNRGRFPGDSDPLIVKINGEPFFSPDVSGTTHVSLKRRGEVFRSEDFSPRAHARGKESGLIFVADLITQIATYDAYGVMGCSYDRDRYYAKRFFASENTPFIWHGGLPVSFAALQRFKATFQDKRLFYTFIHFTMTMGEYQKYGLTYYSVREAVTSLFLHNLWGKLPNLMIDANGKLKNEQLVMWVAAHSGRFPVWHAFQRGFGSVRNPEQNRELAGQIIHDIHQRITPEAEVKSRQLSYVGPIDSGDKELIAAVDVGVYPPANRYASENNRVVFSQDEHRLPRKTFEPWLKAIGGEEGIINGNALYMLGQLDPMIILRAKIREEARDREGKVGRVEDLLNRLRSILIKGE
ncbi:MAG: hypothetical protein KKF06_01210 [Candidatus Margulisbacteria bacterium]|nr:hypothetical protein [Candidatus Margulisiibacteriota bacterium]